MATLNEAWRAQAASHFRDGKPIETFPEALIANARELGVAEEDIEQAVIEERERVEAERGKT